MTCEASLQVGVIAIMTLCSNQYGKQVAGWREKLEKFEWIGFKGLYVALVSRKMEKRQQNRGLFFLC